MQTCLNASLCLKKRAKIVFLMTLSVPFSFHLQERYAATENTHIFSDLEILQKYFWGAMADTYNHIGLSFDIAWSALVFI